MNNTMDSRNRDYKNPWSAASGHGDGGGRGNQRNTDCNNSSSIADNRLNSSNLKNKNTRNTIKHKNEYINTNTKDSNNKNKNVQPQEKSAHDKFREVQIKHIAAAQKLIDNYESSSDEDLENDSLLESVFKNYSDDKSKLQKTQEFLENVFQSGSAICLICIATVKRTESIWSCDNCYSFFHLHCIQRWANDSISLKNLRSADSAANNGYYNNQGEYIQKQKQQINWDCPKCRTVYSPSEIPRHYTCFCKKELNPQNHPWLVPHSCGEMCGKQLEPNCGHKCVLLCHPGPCPPCPQIITKSCECEQSQSKTIRCSQKSWKCLNKCKLKLKCGIHICGLICHSVNDCPECSKKSQQKCVCGAKIMERNCYDSIWQCDKICNKSYSCGLHKCEKKCHSGDCGDCELGLPRSCPCGKTKSQAPCSIEIECCGDTCQKLLACGTHICAQRCHKGDCSQCLEKVEKSCRCGLHSKELPCSKTFNCSVKCKRMRDCQKHACNTKCCDGQCPPCLKICGKTLGCGKHKCTSCCHLGPCYPCTLKGTVKCSCKGTTIEVACGREKSTKPPKCNLLCRIPSKCHHNNVHNCHINECPTCVQICNLQNDTTNCAHPCSSKCHDCVKISIVDRNFKPATPLERQSEIIKIEKLPHPPCETKVMVTCIGGHETVLYPCWNSKSSSCGRRCGRKLKCSNHVCEKQCHEIAGDLNSDLQDENCQVCENECTLKRPNLCVHMCNRPCHPVPCEICSVNLKTPCHCGLTQVYYKCGELYKNDIVDNDLASNIFKEKFFCCGNRCIKNYKCGHRCVDLCHSGDCPNPEQCKKKIKIYCECKNKKIDVLCTKLRSGFQLNCDDSCQIKIEEQRLLAAERERIQKETELERNRQEMEEFEKKFGKKKYKERKPKIITTNNAFNYKPWLIFAAVIISIVTALIIIKMNIDE